MRARRIVAAALALVTVAGMLTACAPEPDPGWRPPTWPAARVAVTSAPEPLDPADVEGLHGQRIRDDALGLQARWAQLPGDAELNARAVAFVREAIAQREAETGVAYAPTVHARGAGLADRGCVAGSTTRPAADIAGDPALGPAGGEGTAVVCDIVTATGAYVGQRMRTLALQDGVAVSDAEVVLYADTSTGAVVSGRELWTADAPALLWEAVVDAVRREHRSLSLAAIAPPDEESLALVGTALDRTVIAPDGTAVFTLPAGFSAPELAALGVAATSEPLIIGVSPAASAPATSDFGAALVQAASAGAGFSPPAPIAAGLEPVDCSLVPCVALTYDDGPSGYTPALLDEAAARHSALTFFVLGQLVAGRADVVARAVAEGHLVENHTWNHPHLPALAPERVRAQLHDTTAAIAAASGTGSTAFRPPYGEYDAMVLAEAGMAAILWDVDTNDWQQPDDDVLVERAVDGPRPGSIVLQHDIHEVTARTAPAVFDGLLDRGFTLVNLRQLFGGELPASGAWRSAR